MSPAVARALEFYAHREPAQHDRRADALRRQQQALLPFADRRIAQRRLAEIAQQLGDVQ